MFKLISKLFFKIFILATAISFVFIIVFIGIFSWKSNEGSQYTGLGITLLALFMLLCNLQILTIYFNYFEFIRNSKSLRFISFYGLPICTYLYEMVNSMHISGYGRFDIPEIVVSSIIYIPVLVAIKIGHERFERINSADVKP